MYKTLAICASFAAAVSAHGNITFPAARQAGPAMAAVCGQAAVDAVNSDPTIPVEDLGTIDAGCPAFLCRGAQFEDNADNVLQLSAGDVVDMEALIPIPHAGPMNVSVVDATTNTLLSDPLISFDVYADESLAKLPPNNTAFSVTVPSNLPAGSCQEAGQCVMQWFWFGTNAVQTYESCVDFVMV